MPDPQLDPPVMSIRIRQGQPRRLQVPVRADLEAAEPLALQLDSGRHDVAKKTIFARLEGDRMILALPDTLMDVLPKNPFAFRDRRSSRRIPASIRKLTIRRGSYAVELEPEKSGGPNRWRMRSPVDAPADVGTVTQA